MEQRTVTLAQLKPTDDAFIDIYQEILKHELCLMRLGDLCVEINGYYVSKSGQSAIHNVDAKLTMLDVIYAALKSRTLEGKYQFNAKDFDSFVKKLVESRLLIDLPCGDEANFMNNALNQSSLVNARLGDNPFIYYYMINELRNRKDFQEIENYLKQNAGTCFKTSYGELIRLYRYEVALPRKLDEPYRVLESYVLPFIEEYVPSRKPELLDKVCEKVVAVSRDEGKKLCDAVREANVKGLHSYQAKMITKLIESLDRPKTAVISAPTGAGKTLIFMTYAVMKLIKYGGVAVVIYPTKALAREQLEFILNLLYSFNAGSSKKIHVYIMDGDSPKSVDEVKGKTFRGGLELRGRTLKYDDSGKVVLDKGNSTELIEWVSEMKSLTEIKEPAVVITNHSMLSKHLNERSKWAADLLKKLNTIVVDEAHVYMNDFEMLNVLHFLLTRLFVNALIEGKSSDVSKLNLSEDIKNLINGRKMDLILSSATLGDRKVIDEKVSISQLGGVNLVNIKNDQEPNLEPLLKWLHKMYGKIDEVYIPYYEAIKEDEVKRKLVVTVINFPIPSSTTQTPFIEGLVTTIIWSEGLSRGLRNVYGEDIELHALAFMDSKTSQREVFNRLTNRVIKYEALHADKLLVSPIMYLRRNTYGKKVIGNLLKATKDPLSDEYLSTYTHLQLFFNRDTVKRYVDLYNQDKADDAKELVKDALEFSNLVYNSDVDHKKSKFGNERSNVYFVMLHNASLDRDVRSEIEKIMRTGKWRLTIATSTLELGVNIPGAAVVVQYGSPSSSENFIQRIGRAGRDNKSLRISFGSLFMKNVGKDISFIDEAQAFKSLFNLEQPKYPAVPDRETLVRFMGLLYRDLRRRLPPEDAALVLNEVLTGLYGTDNNAAREMVDEIDQLVKSYKEVRELLRKGGESRVGLHSFSVMIRQVEEKLKNAYADLDMSARGLTINIRNEKDDIGGLVAQLNDLRDRVGKISNIIHSSSTSRLVTIELIKMVKELEEISKDLELMLKKTEGQKNKIPKVVLQPYQGKIKSAKEAVDTARGLLIGSLGVLGSVGNEAKTSDSLVNLIMGNRLPGPAITDDITGTLLTCNDCKFEEGKTIEFHEGCISKGTSRDELLMTIPFKYYD